MFTLRHFGRRSAWHDVVKDQKISLFYSFISGSFLEIFSRVQCVILEIKIKYRVTITQLLQDGASLLPWFRRFDLTKQAHLY